MKFIIFAALFFISLSGWAKVHSAIYKIPATDGQPIDPVYPLEDLDISQDTRGLWHIKFKLPTELVGDFEVFDLLQNQAGPLGANGEFDGMETDPGLGASAISRVVAECVRANTVLNCRMNYPAGYFEKVDLEFISAALSQKYPDPVTAQNHLQISQRYLSDPEGVISIDLESSDL